MSEERILSALMREESVHGLLTVNIKPGVTDIFNYEMYHAFSGLRGALRLIISLLILLVAGAAFGKVELVLVLALAAIGLLNPVVTPIWLFIKSVRMAAIQLPATYNLSKNVFSVEQGTVTRTVPWDVLALTVWQRNNLILYTGPQTALILPRRQLKGIEKEVKAIICALPNQNRVRICRLA